MLSGPPPPPPPILSPTPTPTPARCCWTQRHVCELWRPSGGAWKTLQVRGHPRRAYPVCVYPHSMREADVGLCTALPFACVPHAVGALTGRRLDCSLFHSFSQRYEKDRLLAMLVSEVTRLVDRIGQTKLVCNVSGPWWVPGLMGAPCARGCEV
jgi:hypothetical protein